jgi:hypothetical protein
MKKSDKLFLFVFTVITLTALVTVFGNNHNPFERKIKNSYKPGVDIIADGAVNQAKKVYLQKKDLGIDLSDGPCLTNDLLPDWVVDVVHNPRQNIDNFPENQCAAFTEGRAKHFVEMDADGNIIRVF